MFKLGIQIYSVRDEYAQNPLSCFRQMKQCGYDGAELFGSIKTHPAEQLKAWLEEAGLEICGYHTQVAEIREDIDAVIAYNRTLGNRFVIVPAPAGPMSTAGAPRRRRQPAVGHRRRQHGRRLHPSNRYGQHAQRRRAAGGAV